MMQWNSTGYGTWEGNGQDLYRTGGAKLEDIISNREDVYEYLIAHGIDRRVAFGIVEDIALGQMSYGGWDKETLEILDRAGIPEWYIQSCQKIIGLTSRMHAITMLKHFGKEIQSEKQ